MADEEWQFDPEPDPTEPTEAEAQNLIESAMESAADERAATNREGLKMAIQRHEIEAWVGPAYEVLTEAQLARVHREAERIQARYPDPDDSDDRETALSAATQYLLGEVSPAGTGDELRRARADEVEARVAAQQVAVMAIEDGMAEAEAARLVGLDRMTIRKALGKR